MNNHIQERKSYKTRGNEIRRLIHQYAIVVVVVVVALVVASAVALVVDIQVTYCCL